MSIYHFVTILLVKDDFIECSYYIIYIHQVVSMLKKRSYILVDIFDIPQNYLKPIIEYHNHF